MPAQPAQAPHRAVLPADDKDEFSWVSALGFAFLTYNTATAAYGSIHDPWALAFVLVAYLDLVALYWCLRKFERADERNKQRLKAGVWILATVLTAMFSYKVAAIMPWPVAAIVWCMGSATTIGGFYAFFLYRDPSLDKLADATKL